MANPTPRPVVLCILDGWGYRTEKSYNAIAMANTPTWTKLWDSCPHALIHTEGLTVGLPAGQMGNSEVGHITMGAGRVLMQDLPKIDQAIADGSLAQHSELLSFTSKLRERDATCHLMGLCSPGGVHAHQAHILALAKIITQQGVRVALHVFTDGRDVAPKSAAAQIKQLAEALPVKAVIQTISGRYYAMDRDKRWERTELAYNAIVNATGASFTDPVAAIEQSYAQNVTDEFIMPTVRTGYQGISDGDGVLFANFRADRARQILTALLDPDFNGFTRPLPKLTQALGMVEYSAQLNKFMKAIFPPKQLDQVLGEVVSAHELKQLRIAETEKYAHVTFFFNGGEEKVYPGEERILVPSPKVATYDLQPEMSAPEVAHQCAQAIRSRSFDLIVLNFANADMVGHSGNLQAAIKAVEAVDAGLEQITKALTEVGGAMLITADHGNCEQMWDEQTHGPHTAHSLNPVPVLLFGGPTHIELRSGTLQDIAPTLLDMMQLEQPASMTGRSLIVTGGKPHA